MLPTVIPDAPVAERLTAPPLAAPEALEARLPSASDAPVMLMDPPRVVIELLAFAIENTPPATKVAEFPVPCCRLSVPSVSALTVILLDA